MPAEGNQEIMHFEEENHTYMALNVHISILIEEQFNYFKMTSLYSMD